MMTNIQTEIDPLHPKRFKTSDVRNATILACLLIQASKHLVRRYLDPKNIPKTPQEVFGRLGYVIWSQIDGPSIRS